MSCVGRILGLLRIRFHSTLERLEQPALMADEYVRQIDAQHRAARDSLAQLAGQLGIMRSRWQRSLNDADTWQRRAEAAVRAGDDQLARSALESRRASLAAAEQYRIQSEQGEQHLQELRRALTALEQRVRQARAQRDLIKVKASRARSTTALSGGRAQQTGERLAEIEERLDDRLAHADAAAALERQSLERRLDSLQSDQSLDEELLALKRQIVAE